MEISNVLSEPALNDHDINRMEELFQAAADLPQADQAAFLERKCGGDNGLQSRVQRLLDRLADQSSLTSPIADRNRHVGPFPAAAITEGPGAIIDRYKLLQVIGEGGFGIVYMAEQQQPVVRKVALKIIKLGMDTREVIARFEAERQALAMMDHPHIAKVLDGGATNSGRPYFVMELVRGVSITEYCDKNHVGTRDRLELFASVCQAVQHAHQKGVIHRDLKPSNVMVTLSDGAPMPKVIDFGVAKAMHARLTDKTLFTRYEQFVGTPAYMSPEQAEMSALDIDTRTDIYSLGVLLYEILTGTTPFDSTTLRKAGLAEIQRIIREEQPPRPSLRISTTADVPAARHGDLDLAGLRRALRGDLDWIVMKALEKDRGRRYASASEFADDIRKHLRSEPVIAGPPGAGYRLRKFLARNRAAAVGVFFVVLALVAGIIGTTTAMIKAERNARDAQTQTDRAMTAVDFLLSTLSLTNPEIALNPEVTVLTLLDHTSAGVADAFADDPGAEVRVRATIGHAYARLGKHAQAEPHLRRVVEIVDGHSDSEDMPDQTLHAAGFGRLDFYNALWTLTETCFNLQRTDNFAMATRAHRVGMAHIGETQPILSERLDRFSKAVEAGAWSHAPDAMEGVAELFELAAAEADSAFAVGDPHWSVVATTFMAAGYGVWYTPHEPLAADFWGRALEIQRRELPSNHPTIANTVGLIVGVFNKSGRLAESESLIRESLDSLRKVQREGSFGIGRAELMLGETLTLQGRYEEAEPVLLSSYQIVLESIKDETNWLVIESTYRLVNLYHAWQRPELAKPYRDALAVAGATSKYVIQWEMSRGGFGPKHQAFIDAGDRLKELCGGVCYTAVPGVSNAPGTLPAAREFVAQRARILADDRNRSAVAARLVLGWANALDPVAQNEARRVMAEAAYEVLQEWVDQIPLDSAEAAAILADCARADGALDNAKHYATQACKLLAAGHPLGDWMTASQEVRIARSLLREGMYVQAEELLLSGFGNLRIQIGDTHPDTNIARELLRELYTNMGRPLDAERYAEIPAPGE